MTEALADVTLSLTLGRFGWALTEEEAENESLGGGAAFRICRTPAGRPMITDEVEECGVSDHCPVLLRDDTDALEGLLKPI